MRNIAVMLDRIQFPLTLASAIGCGLIAGMFFAFSTFVMKGLGKLPPPQGIAAMQSINVVVINPWFMAVFLGTGVTCLLLMVQVGFHWQQHGSGLRLLAGLAYLIGTIGVTIALNVPLNDALAKVDPASEQGVAFWAMYLSRWTLWNHVRMAAAVVAMVLFILSLVSEKQAWP